MKSFGQQMISNQFTTDGLIELNVEDLKTGLYFIKVEYDKNKQIVQKFIKN